jgi:hypothetical protein
MAMNWDNVEKAQPDVGCERCWPADPDVAWEAHRKLERRTRLVDSSHYIASILICDSCRQQFVSKFTESIDWVDGDDPQYWTLVPVTPEEADALTRKPVVAVEAEIHKLFPGRRSLKHDSPKGGPQRSYWSTGF